MALSIFLAATVLLPVALANDATCLNDVCYDRVEVSADLKDASNVQCCRVISEGIAPEYQNCGGSRPTGLPFAGRSPVLARHGMAATSQPLSTQVALDILKSGGNAIDAAIAANAMEGVVEPMMNGIGGDIMAMIWHNKSNKLYGYNGSGRSPKSLSLAELQNLSAAVGSEGNIPTHGPLPVSVPGAVKGWCDLHQRFGKLDFAAVLAPAIRYAREGFPVSEVIASDWGLPSNNSEMTSNGKYPKAIDGIMSTFTVDGKRAPRVGEIFRNRDLAESLEKIANTHCDDFYNGSIAEAIANFASVGGTHLTKEDLSSHHGEWVDPVSTTYRDDYRVFELPPNPQGLAALIQLNILEGYDLQKMGFNSADYLHVHVEAKKLAFADRARYFADPDFVKVPVEGLLSKDYAAQRRSMINMSHAAQRVDAGTPNEHASKFTGDTIYLTVADDEGNMVSLIQSNYHGFGSGLVVPGLGFALQDRGALFNLANTTADVYAPGKRPFHTIIPGFVTKADKPWLSFGVMGGNMQPQGHAQILSNLIDFGMNVQEAGDAARYYHTDSSQPTGYVMEDGGVLELEAGVCPTVVADLQARGHKVYGAPNGGGYQAIMLDTSSGVQVYHGASEMRKDGQAAGY
eukprot:TRINITY_DN9637_c0_g2_i2.p1 TRINITY_DN9637_c0_g2~~TRINITY_DN9637_c0_g2_i2.p1  ORF type:complete len:629 (+),score=142.66 TRINITY_DN9637_c0_g2_i2:9-1895(+)